MLRESVFVNDSQGARPSAIGCHQLPSGQGKQPTPGPRCSVSRRPPRSPARDGNALTQQVNGLGDQLHVRVLDVLVHPYHEPMPRQVPSQIPTHHRQTRHPRLRRAGPCLARSDPHEEVVARLTRRPRRPRHTAGDSGVRGRHPARNRVWLALMRACWTRQSRLWSRRASRWEAGSVGFVAGSTGRCSSRGSRVPTTRSHHRLRRRDLIG